MQRKAVRSASGTVNDPGLRYQAVADALEARIASGSVKPLQRLPGENDLAREFGVSRATVRAALTLLETKGAVVRRPGVGTFVALARLRHDLAILENLFGQLARRGADTKMELLDYRWATVDDATCAHLGYSAAIQMSRIFYVDSLPFAVTKTYLHPVAKTVPYAEFEETQGYVILEGMGQHIARADINVRAERPTAEVARSLAITRSDFVLVLERTSFSQTDEVLEYTKCYVRSDVIEFHLAVYGSLPMVAQIQDASPVKRLSRRAT